jgi:hypothetical protein
LQGTPRRHAGRVQHAQLRCDRPVKRMLRWRTMSC